MLDVHSFDFRAKTILITGAASGIGAAMARAFAEQGANLRLADLNHDGLLAVAKTLSGSAGDIQTRVFDQRSSDDIRALADWAKPVDVLANNAGIIGYGPFADQADNIVQEVIQTNLIGPILLAKRVGSEMLERGRGVIVNTTSQLAFCGAPERAVYASAKAGLAQFTRSSAAEWGPRGVRVVAIAPGRTLTPMNADVLADPETRARALEDIPLRRFGEAAEIARLVVFLASDVAGYIAGQSLIADGGYVIAH